ncbi:carbohydrate ABC transporter permease [Isoptericola sp. NPDC057653]|uniref:carbohydrate ABC transporter permease n=1 Tax=Isoptericola sp. NPDC057653 TaxID=3346195 RepID=UPI0036817139
MPETLTIPSADPAATAETTTTSGVPRRPHGKRRARPGVFLALTIISIVLLLPFLLLVITSLKSGDQLSSADFVWFPVPAAVENFVSVFTEEPFAVYALNSVFLATISGVLSTFFSALVGYGFARLRGPGKKFMFGVLISMMLVPGIVTLIPTYLLFSQIGLVGTYWPWVLWGISGSPFMIFLYRQFFAGLPRELEEAATLDGCSRFGTFMRIFLPVSKPIIVTVFVLSFTGVWGDFITPNLMLNYDNTTLAVALASGYVNDQGFPLNNLIAAASILYVVPMIVVFLFAQRSYVAGFATAGIK